MRCEVCGQGAAKHWPGRHEDWLRQMERCREGEVSLDFWTLHEVHLRLGKDWMVELLTVDLLESWLLDWPEAAPSWDSVRDRLYAQYVVDTIRDVQAGMSLWVAQQRRACEAQLAHAAWLSDKYGDEIPCTYTITVDSYEATAKLDKKTLIVRLKGRTDDRIARLSQLDATWSCGSGRVVLGASISNINSD